MNNIGYVGSNTPPDGTTFTDAQMMALKHPDTFEAPSWDKLANVKKGSIVKVIIGGERFWNVVTKVRGDNITAKIDNDLINTDIHGLECGDLITFQKKNISSIWED